MDSFEKVCDFTLRAVTATKSQGSETWETGSENFIEGLYEEQESNTGRQTVQNQICYCFFSTEKSNYSPVKICHYLNRVQCL